MKVRILVSVALILMGVVATQYLFSASPDMFSASLDVSTQSSSGGHAGALAWCFLYDDGSGLADASVSWYTLVTGEYSLSCSVSGDDTIDSASETGAAVGTNSVYIVAELPSDATSAYAYAYIWGIDIGGTSHSDSAYDFCDQPD